MQTVPAQLTKQDNLDVEIRQSQQTANLQSLSSKSEIPLNKMFSSCDISTLDLGQLAFNFLKYSNRDPQTIKERKALVDNNIAMESYSDMDTYKQTLQNILSQENSYSIFDSANSKKKKIKNLKNFSGNFISTRSSNSSLLKVGVKKSKQHSSTSSKYSPSRVTASFCTTTQDFNTMLDPPSNPLSTSRKEALYTDSSNSVNTLRDPQKQTYGTFEEINSLIQYQDSPKYVVNRGGNTLQSPDSYQAQSQIEFSNKGLQDVNRDNLYQQQQYQGSIQESDTQTQVNSRIQQLTASKDLVFIMNQAKQQQVNTFPTQKIIQNKQCDNAIYSCNTLRQQQADQNTLARVPSMAEFKPENLRYLIEQQIQEAGKLCSSQINQLRQIEQYIKLKRQKEMDEDTEQKDKQAQALSITFKREQEVVNKIETLKEYPCIVEYGTQNCGIVSKENGCSQYLNDLVLIDKQQRNYIGKSYTKKEQIKRQQGQGLQALDNHVKSGYDSQQVASKTQVDSLQKELTFKRDIIQFNKLAQSNSQTENLLRTTNSNEAPEVFAQHVLLQNKVSTQLKLRKPYIQVQNTQKKYCEQNTLLPSQKATSFSSYQDIVSIQHSFQPTNKRIPNRSRSLPQDIFNITYQKRMYRKYSCIGKSKQQKDTNLYTHHDVGQINNSIYNTQELYLKKQGDENTPIKEIQAQNLYSVKQISKGNSFIIRSKKQVPSGQDYYNKSVIQLLGESVDTNSKQQSHQSLESELGSNLDSMEFYQYNPKRNISSDCDSSEQESYKDYVQKQAKQGISYPQFQRQLKQSLTKQRASFYPSQQQQQQSSDNLQLLSSSTENSWKQMLQDELSSDEEKYSQSTQVGFLIQDRVGLKKRYIPQQRRQSQRINPDERQLFQSRYLDNQEQLSQNPLQEQDSQGIEELSQGIYDQKDLEFKIVNSRLGSINLSDSRYIAQASSKNLYEQQAQSFRAQPSYQEVRGPTHSCRNSSAARQLRYDKLLDSCQSLDQSNTESSKQNKDQMPNKAHQLPYRYSKMDALLQSSDTESPQKQRIQQQLGQIVDSWESNNDQYKREIDRTFSQPRRDQKDQYPRNNANFYQEYQEDQQQINDEIQAQNSKFQLKFGNQGVAQIHLKGEKLYSDTKPFIQTMQSNSIQGNHSINKPLQSNQIYHQPIQIYSTPHPTNQYIYNSQQNVSESQHFVQVNQQQQEQSEAQQSPQLGSEPKTDVMLHQGLDQQRQGLEQKQQGLFQSQQGLEQQQQGLGQLQLGLGQQQQGLRQQQQGLRQQMLGLGQQQIGLGQQQKGLGQQRQSIKAIQQGLGQQQKGLSQEQSGLEQQLSDEQTQQDFIQQEISSTQQEFDRQLFEQQQPEYLELIHKPSDSSQSAQAIQEIQQSNIQDSLQINQDKEASVAQQRPKNSLFKQQLMQHNKSKVNLGKENMQNKRLQQDNKIAAQDSAYDTLDSLLETESYSLDLGKTSRQPLGKVQGCDLFCQNTETASYMESQYRATHQPSNQEIQESKPSFTFSLKQPQQSSPNIYLNKHKQLVQNRNGAFYDQAKLHLQNSSSISSIILSKQNRIACFGKQKADGKQNKNEQNKGKQKPKDNKPRKRRGKDYGFDTGCFGSHYLSDKFNNVSHSQILYSSQDIAFQYETQSPQGLNEGLHQDETQSGDRSSNAKNRSQDLKQLLLLYNKPLANIRKGAKINTQQRAHSISCINTTQFKRLQAKRSSSDQNADNSNITSSLEAKDSIKIHGIDESVQQMIGSQKSLYSINSLPILANYGKLVDDPLNFTTSSSYEASQRPLDTTRSLEYIECESEKGQLKNGDNKQKRQDLYNRYSYNCLRSRSVISPIGDSNLEKDRSLVANSDFKVITQLPPPQQLSLQSNKNSWKQLKARYNARFRSSRYSKELEEQDTQQCNSCLNTTVSKKAQILENQKQDVHVMHNNHNKDKKKKDVLRQKKRNSNTVKSTIYTVPIASATGTVSKFEQFRNVNRYTDSYIKEPNISKQALDTQPLKNSNHRFCSCNAIKTESSNATNNDHDILNFEQSNYMQRQSTYHLQKNQHQMADNMQNQQEISHFQDGNVNFSQTFKDSPTLHSQTIVNGSRPICCEPNLQLEDIRNREYQRSQDTSQGLQVDQAKKVQEESDLNQKTSEIINSTNRMLSLQTQQQLAYLEQEYSQQQFSFSNQGLSQDLQSSNGDKKTSDTQLTQIIPSSSLNQFVVQQRLEGGFSFDNTEQPSKVHTENSVNAKRLQSEPLNNTKTKGLLWSQQKLRKSSIFSQEGGGNPILKTWNLKQGKYDDTSQRLKSTQSSSSLNSLQAKFTRNMEPKYVRIESTKLAARQNKFQRLSDQQKYFFYTERTFSGSYQPNNQLDFTQLPIQPKSTSFTQQQDFDLKSAPICFSLHGQRHSDTLRSSFSKSSGPQNACHSGSQGLQGSPINHSPFLDLPQTLQFEKTQQHTQSQSIQSYNSQSQHGSDRQSSSKLPKGKKMRYGNKAKSEELMLHVYRQDSNEEEITQMVDEQSGITVAKPRGPPAQKTLSTEIIDEAPVQPRQNFIRAEEYSVNP